MARPKAFDQEKALEAAMLAFWRHGYLGTGIQELVTATGINRASLYGTFGNKKQLFLQALRRYTDICVSELRGALRSGETPLAGIRAMLDHFMASVLGAARGCMLYNTALEVSGYDEDISREVMTGMERIEALLLRQVEAAQAAGEVNAALEPVLPARAAMAAMQSMTIRGGAAGAPEVLESIRDGAMLIFQPPAAN